MATSSTVPVVVPRAGALNITVEQYTGLRVPLLVTDSDTGDPIDFTGYTFRSDAAKSIKDPTVLASLTVDPIDLVNGRIDLVFTAANITSIGGNGVYDLIAVPGGGDPERILKGVLIWDPGITQ